MNKYTKPNWRQAAVVTIDTQNDFSLPGAVAEIQGTYDVIPNMRTILKVCRQKNVPVIHMIRLYREDGSNAELCRKEALESGNALVLPGTEGADLVDAMKPNGAAALDYAELLKGRVQPIGPQEWAVYKPRWGAFYQTRLEHFLRERGIDTLIFTGCNFPNCPRTSIYEASERDFKVVMVEDAVSGVYRKGIEELRSIGVHIYHTNELLEELQ
ncbi:cysteine hydrolase family protein [Paenibacillus sp. y28]|uniref:cysteine hydrolase family protein n=1 Tax=Paenibacillus sp. y28 TaxID=3129110 RepID=UPI00301B0254